MRPEQTVQSTVTEIAEVMQPNDANHLGKVFGGKILSMIDLAAYATASKFAKNVTVTASFDRVDFHKPIEVGELVTCRGHVSYAGRTSLEVTIDIYATDIVRGETRHTNTARVTMVAVDAEAKPTPVPKLVCESRDEKVGFLKGRVRRHLRSHLTHRLEDIAREVEELAEEELVRLVEGSEAEVIEQFALM